MSKLFVQNVFLLPSGREERVRGNRIEYKKLYVFVLL